MPTPTLAFPPGFWWGSATSAHQTEGWNVNSDWWRAEQQGTVPHRSGAACDSWNRWQADLELLRQMGLNSYRFSLEWSRIEPEPGRFDAAALEHYRQILLALRAANIQPIVTLHHFTTPLWMAERGAWTSREIVARFAAYTAKVGEALGDLVDWWVTINEPSVMGLFGYMTGLFPPHRKMDFLGYLRHMENCLRGHAAARAVLKAQRPSAQVSMAFHLNPMDPHKTGDVTDKLAVRLYDWLWQGRLLSRAAPKLDWIGINYYFRLFVRWDLFPWRLMDQPSMGAGTCSEYGWEIYPEGLYRVLKRVGALGKPVIVTENGIADADDDQRAGFILEHLTQVHRALREGVDVRGYVHWSLLDNFEWTEGFRQRFGLAGVDFRTHARALRPSAHVYGKIARANAINSGVIAGASATSAPGLARAA